MVIRGDIINKKIIVIFILMLLLLQVHYFKEITTNIITINPNKTLNSIQEFDIATQNNFSYYSRSSYLSDINLKYIEDDFINDSMIAETINVTINSNESKVTLIMNYPEEYFIKNYGDKYDDNGFAAIQTSDGGYISVGELTRYSGISDVLLIKTDKYGNFIWDVTYGGDLIDSGISILQTEDEGFIILGRTESYASDGNDIWLIKTDKLGNMQWNKTIGRSISDTGNSIQPTSDGGYLIAGTTFSSERKALSIWIIKTDINGLEEWNHTYPSSDNDTIDYYGIAGCETPEGGYIVVGHASNFVLLKLYQSGIIEWSRTYNLNDKEEAKSVISTSDNGYMIIGDTYFNREDDYSYDSDILVIKTNNTGIQEWNKSYGGRYRDYGTDVIEIDGGYIIGGSSAHEAKHYYDAWIIETNLSGEVVWNRTYGYDDIPSEYCHSIKRTSDGGFIICGQTSAYHTEPDWDLLLLKIDKNGDWSIFSDSYGEFTSIDLLEGKEVDRIFSLDYEFTTVLNSNFKFYLSQDGNDWLYARPYTYNLSDFRAHNHTIDITSLNWEGPAFYYKVVFTAIQEYPPFIGYINLTYGIILDTDNDGIGDDIDSDDDNDGYLDDWEKALNHDHKNRNDTPYDNDLDGEPDGDINNSLPWMDYDDDNDNLPDFWEIMYGLDPKNPYDADFDFDSDRFTNKEEYDADTDPSDPDDKPKDNKKGNKTSEIKYTIYIIISIFIIVFLIILAIIVNQKMKKN